MFASSHRIYLNLFSLFVYLEHLYFIYNNIFISGYKETSNRKVMRGDIQEDKKIVGVKRSSSEGNWKTECK